jgi:hypothetical protein
MNESHLPGILQRHTRCYTTQRTYLGINMNPPEPREVQASGMTRKVAVANGLHHYYFRNAA